MFTSLTVVWPRYGIYWGFVLFGVLINRHRQKCTCRQLNQLIAIQKDKQIAAPSLNSAITLVVAIKQTPEKVS